jgi:hypothetical protein
VNVWHWRIDTANFTFDAFADSATQCRLIMCAAWRKHAKLTRATYTWEDVESGAPYQIEIGRVYRDGEAFSRG